MSHRRPKSRKRTQRNIPEHSQVSTTTSERVIVIRENEQNEPNGTFWNISRANFPPARSAPRAPIISRMEKRPFGRTGLSVSVLGFGGAPIGYLKTDRDRVSKILNFLLDRGVNLIDTAASYPGSEEVIADTIGHRRDQIVLVSKCGQKVEGVSGEDWSPQLIAQTIDRSLKRLKTDRLDVMLLHSCKLEVLQKGEAVAALAKARDAGKIRFAGYSGDNDAVAYAATLPDIAVVETSISIADQVNIATLLPVARKQNVGVLAKRPIANAGWKDPSQQKGLYQNYAKPYTERLAKMAIQPADLGFSGPPEMEWPRLALRFTLSFPEVGSAIIGTTNPANAQKNIDYAAEGPLPAETVAKIRAAFQHADPVGAWHGLT
jgi:aryl-alcohol dehydrogenase-like predicted oxidoreductase